MAVDPSKTASKGGKDAKSAAKTGAKAKVKSPKDKLDPILAELLIVGLILFTLSVEVILHKLEHWIAHKHVQMQAVLRNLYREVMILGLVSFGFVLFVLLKPPATDLDKDKLIKFTFEIAHVFIFLFAVFYTFVVMSSVFMSLRLSARWKKLERMELVKYLEKKEKYRKLRDRMRRHKSIYWRYIRWWFPKINRVFRYRKLHEIMTFHDIRFQFIYYRNLPHDFRFSSFLRKVKSATFIELVEPHWSHYICFLLIVLLDLLRRKVNLLHNDFTPLFLIAESVLNIVLVSIFAVKIRSIYWKMTKNPATYYDSVDRHVFEEELIIAEEQERIERESAVGSRAGSRAISRPTSPGPANLGVPGTPGEREITPEKEDGLRGSLDRPREPRGSRVSTEFRNRPRSSRPSLEHKHTPIYQNLAYKPPASVGSSGTATPHGHGEQSDLELEVVASRHSLDFQKDATLDLSKVATPSLTAGSSPRLSHADRVDRGQSHSARPSARSSFDKPGRYVPSLRKQDGTIALAEVAVAAAKRRSMEKPRNSDAGARGDATPSRASLDDRARGTHTPVFRGSRDGRMSNASARRTSVDLVQTIPTDELAERDDDARYSTASRRSVELAHAFPAEELAKRNQLPKNKSRRRKKDKSKDHTVVDIDGDERDGDDEADPREGNLSSGPSYASRLRAEAIRRVRKRKTANPSIIKNAIQREEAQQQAPTGNYPNWLLKLLPRLKRVASPAEKLFWFGSHRFYLWCVEWVLFFTTVNMAASATIFAVEAADYNVKKSKGSNKWFPFVHLAAFLAGLVTLFYVLMRIAGIMKKYVFVLNNANLVPETMTIQAIQTVSLKNHLQHDMYHEGDESDSSDNEHGEGETASENRRKLWKFLSNDAEGRIPGAESGAVGGGKRRISVASRRDSAQPPTEQVEAVASHSMDGSATAEVMWQP